MSDALDLQQTLYNSANPTRRWLHRTRRDWIISAVRRAETGRGSAIEVGPGSGVYLPTLATQFDKVTVVDIEDAFLENARRLALKHPNIEVLKTDITQSRLPAAGFDLVLCSEVIEHISDSPAVLFQLRRILKPGGRLILSTPHRWSTLETTARLALKPGFIQITRLIYGEPVFETGHINLMTRGTLVRQLQDAGFDIIERASTGLYVPLVAEFTGRAGLALQKKLADWLRGSLLEQLLWTQYCVCKPI